MMCVCGGEEESSDICTVQNNLHVEGWGRVKVTHIHVTVFVYVTVCSEDLLMVHLCILCTQTTQNLSYQHHIQNQCVRRCKYHERLLFTFIIDLQYLKLKKQM